MSPIALFIHSTGAFSSMWRPHLEAIEPGTLVLTPDNLGYPPHPPLPRGQPVTSLDDAKHLLAQLPTDGPVDLYGHSYGGLVALELLDLLGDRARSIWLFEPVIFGALHTLRPGTEAAERALAMVAQPGFFDDEIGGTDPWLEHFVDYWNRPGSWARMPDALRDPIRAVGWKMYQEVRQAFFRITGAPDRPLPTLPAKATLLMGERSPHEARVMVGLLAEHNPHARLIDLPSVGHMAPLTHPGIVRATVREHAAAVLAPSSTQAVVD